MIRRASLLVATAAVWGVAAWLLWRTTVPSSLHLPHVDPHRFFTAAQLHAASSFSTVESLLTWGGVLAQIAALTAYARWGARWARESAAGPVGTGMLLLIAVWSPKRLFGNAKILESIPGAKRWK